MVKVPKEKKELICELYSQGKGIVEISNETKTYSDNVRKIIVERFGELPKKCKMDKDSFDEKVKAIHPHLDVLYYDNLNAKAKLYCNIHQIEFEKFCKPVLKGADCPKCKESKKVIKPSKEKKAKSKTFSEETKTKEYFEFLSKCVADTSNQKSYYAELISSYQKNVEKDDEGILKGNKIDILVDKKVGLMLNCSIFHGERNNKNLTTKSKNCHIEKSDFAAEQGVKLYHIFDSEYVKNPELVEHKILNACGLNTGVKINARDCEIKDISYKDSVNFLNKYHIQGGDVSPVRYGAFIKDSLGEFSIMVGVMTFKSGDLDGEWDLNRFATNYDYHVRGLASKMLKRFERDYSPSTLKTFADIRWTPKGDDNLYTKLGFDLVEKQPPVYHYFHPREPEVLYNRVRFQKHKILEKHSYLDPEMTEKQMMEFLGYDRVWDCGNWKFIKQYSK